MWRWRSRFVSALVAGAVLTGTAAALAQSATAISPPGNSSKRDAYPTKLVRVITAGAGTTADIVTRKIGQQLSERWGQSVIVENRSGAALTIGTAAAAKATPDGYTLLMSDRSAIAVAPSLYRDLPYRPLRDLAPITLVAVMSALLVAHPSVPAANLREFIEHAKRNSGTVNMAVGAPGSGGHIATALFRQMTGADVVMVPYKGGNQTILAVVSGEAKAALNSMPTSLPHVKSGRLKAYASSGHTRFAGTPDIPTLAEAGVPGYHSEYWLGMFAPAGVPAALVARLNREIVEILQAPAIRAALLAEGAEPSPKTPADFSTFIVSETTRMKKIIDLAGVRAE